MHIPATAFRPMDDAQHSLTAGTSQPARSTPGLPSSGNAAFASAFDASLEVFHGQATTAEARFYARLRATVEPGWQLTGEVVGPFSHRTRCLPATIRFRRPMKLPAAAESPGGDLLVEAIVPDPCFWQPEQPFYYGVAVRLVAGETTLAEVRRQLGVRPLGAHGRRFYMQGKPWVLRAVTPGTSVADDDWLDALELGTTLLVAQPPADLCEQANRHGVLLMATAASPSADELVRECRRLALHPAVGLLLLDADAPCDDACRAAARNLLMGCRLDFARHAGPALADAVPAWAQFAVLRWPQEYGPEAYAELAAQLAVPVGVERTPQRFSTLAAAKAGCDSLQRALAGRGEFAGYIC